ncbi:MAG: prefoldin subunit alpha [Methanotrichaceae archaeon]
MTETLSEEDIRQLLQTYQQYQAEAEVIAHQLELFQLSIKGCNNALSTIEAMESSEEGQNMLVPIDEGSFIHAKLASKNKVILGVGANVSIEKTTADARESLSKRKSQLEEGIKKLNGTLRNINQNMAQVQSVITQYEQSTSRGGIGVQ